MGLVSSYPTSYLITNDPLPMGLFIHYNPENFMQIPNTNFTLDQKSLNVKLQQAVLRGQDCFFIDDIPKVGIPNIRITYSMEGETLFKYTITKQPLKIGLQFYVSGQCSDVPLDYQIEISPNIEVSSLLTYDGKQARVYTNQPSMTGLYSIKITARSPNFVNRSTEFQIRVNPLPIHSMVSTARSAPYFVTDPDRFLNVTFESTRIYKLPEIKNPNPLHTATISFKSQYKNSLPNFMQFKNGKLYITPTVTGEIAMHTIEIILTNQNEQKQKYIVYVQILPKNDSVFESRIQIDISQRKDFDEQSRRENFPTVQSMRINNKGEVSLRLKYKNGVPKFLITEENFLFEIQPRQALNWSIKEVSNDFQRMKLQLQFANPNSISMSSLNRAKLKIFFKPSIGLTLRGRFLQSSPEDAFLFYQEDTEVPVQLSSNEVTKFFDSVSDAFKSITTSILATNLSFTLLLSCSMQLLWSFVNSLQLISLIPLMNLVIPSNLYYICSLIAGPLQFKIIDISSFTARLFQIKTEYEAYSTHFESFGVENVLLILDLQISLYVLLLSPAIFFILFLFNKSTKKCEKANKFAKRLSRIMQYSFFVRMLIEEFILVFLSSMVNILRPNFETWGEIFSFTLSIVMIILTISLPMALTVYIIKRKDTLEKRKKLGQKLGSIYQDMRKDDPIHLLFSVFYVIRRLIFVLSVLFLGSCPMLQIMLFHLTSVAQFVYLGLWKPFEDPRQNKIELLNEGCVLIISTLLPAFTDYLSDDTGLTQLVLGWVVLGLIFLQCAINIVIQLKDQWFKVKVVWLRIRHCRTKWQSVKIMSDTQVMDLTKFKEEQPNETKDLSRRNASQGTRTDKKDWKYKSGQIEMMPMAEIPSHEQTFSKGLNVESLQLFTPRGRHLFGREIFEEDQIEKDVKIQDIIEEQKSEDEIQYLPQDQWKFDRAATAGQYPRNRMRDAHLNQLKELSTLSNQDDFFQQFSILPLENLQKTLESSRVRKVPQISLSRQFTLKDNPDTETLDPYSVYNNTQTLSLHHQFTNAEQNQLSSTMPTTVPHLQDSPFKNDKKSSSGGNNSGITSQMDTSSENLKYRIGSSEGSSQNTEGSGNAVQKQQQQQKPRTKKPNSRIKIYS